MRFRFIVSLLLALVALGVTASTALMATQTQVIGGGVNGLVFCAYTYDDVSHQMTSLVLTNNSTNTHTVTGVAMDPNTLSIVASGTWSLTANSVKTFNITPLNLFMTDHIAKDGVTHYFTPPYIMGCAVS